ncbi:aldo/keto reductase [Homoserinimonas aerilata]|uniref:aldo/keto reductase n=1 Tax=Homoserinimonas aerilata TaxID=1162970 RepID=UPI001FE88F1C|nr:aldo/keto reductase [Homoserinimonas aerilata]
MVDTKSYAGSAPTEATVLPGVVAEVAEPEVAEFVEKIEPVGTAPVTLSERPAEPAATVPFPVIPRTALLLSHAPKTLEFWGRRLGASDLTVFPLAIGGNVFGLSADAAASREVLDVFADHGGNLIDTADSYSDGRSEEIIGEWMRDRGARSRMVIGTKVGKGAEFPGVTGPAVTSAVEASLRRLGTEYIDLLSLHIDDEAVPFDETLLAVDELIRAGKVRYFGVSDHSANRLVEARVIAAQLGVAPLIAVQSRYNLIERTGYEPDLARVVAQQGLGFLPRFGLAGGFLAGKYRTRADLGGRARRKETAGHLTKRNLRVLSALDRVAEEQGASVATIAIAWLLTRPGVVAPVVSANSAEQVYELVAAARVQLSRHQALDLERASDL